MTENKFIDVLRNIRNGRHRWVAEASDSAGITRDQFELLEGRGVIIFPDNGWHWKLTTFGERMLRVLIAFDIQVHDEREKREGAEDG